MDAEQRKRAGALLALVVVLAAVVAWQFWPRVGASATSASRPVPASATRQQAAGPAEATPLDVRLDRLDLHRREPGESSRDPFRFRSEPPPPPPPAAGTTAPPAGGLAGGSATGEGGQPLQPPPPPPPPPIALKFIGVVSREAKTRIAVLSDGKFVFHGREGDIIEGRYRVVRIGEESVQMEYLDGRGRQTIRLSGS